MLTETATVAIEPVTLFAAISPVILTIVGSAIIKKPSVRIISAKRARCFTGVPLLYFVSLCRFLTVRRQSGEKPGSGPILRRFQVANCAPWSVDTLILLLFRLLLNTLQHPPDQIIVFHYGSEI